MAKARAVAAPIAARRAVPSALPSRPSARSRDTNPFTPLPLANTIQS